MTAEKEKIAGDAHRQNAFRMDWLAKGHSLIPNAIMAVSNDFVQKGSLLLYAAIPVTSSVSLRSRRPNLLVAPVPPVIFDVRQSGHLEMRARLQFQIDLLTGKVSVSSSLSGIALPASIDISELTTQWVSQAAEMVLISALEGNDSRLNTLDEDDGNYVPN